MILDFADPVGTIQMVLGIIILVELIQLLDKEDLTKHIEGRVKFYSGIFGKVWGFLKVAGSGFKIIGNQLFPRKEKDQEPEEDPFEGEGGIEG